MAILLILALALRAYGMDWDQWFHLHPDERMLIMVTERIDFFKNLNPDFFNYGSLPVYLLRLFNPEGTYYTLLKSGRILSVGFDLATIIFVYKISDLIFKNRRIAAAASFFYAIAFFPIQNSHFFVVDVLLTTLTTILVYQVLTYLKQPSLKKIIFLGINFAAMIATKFTAVVLLPVVAGAILWKNLAHKKHYKKTFMHLTLFILVLTGFFFIFMPYAFIESGRFLMDIGAQIKMNSNPYVFPYTLQYVGTIPYLYYLKNIFFWGLGPFISFFFMTGLFHSKKYFRNHAYLFLLVVLCFYFLVIGRSAVKFMRYMLPIYPILAVFAGYGISKVKEISRPIAMVFMGLAIAWSLCFVNIYSSTHTRIAASEWMSENIPLGSTIAVEHWDDRLPLSGSENYVFEELTLYDQPDDGWKWSVINEKLKKSDYMIIASNRLYTPLQRLTDCQKYKSCYPETGAYYKKLFSGRLGFEKVAEFSVYPGVKIGRFSIGIDDQSADESFTVYDHPRIIIFKKLH